MPIQVENFTTCDGSMTSDDGLTFYYHVRREDGSELMLGFPHMDVNRLFNDGTLYFDR